MYTNNQKKCYWLALIFLISISIIETQVVLAQEVTKDEDQGTFEVYTSPKPIDLVQFGHIDVMREGEVENVRISSSEVNLLVENLSTTMIVKSFVPGDYAILLNNDSYTYINKESADYTFSNIQTPKARLAWRNQKIVNSLITEEVAQRLNETMVSWKIWQGIDDEGLVAYDIWLQSNTNIVEITLNTFASSLNNEFIGQSINSSDEQLTQYHEWLHENQSKGIAFEELLNEDRANQVSVDLINHLIIKLLSQSSPNIYKTYIPLVINTNTITADTPIHPATWIPNIKATQWTRSGTHYLAEWNAPNAYGPQFLGTGGFNTTCSYSGSNGCIDQWTWWLKYPISRLGVPKTFLLTAAWAGANDIENYSATVWL